MDFPFKLLTFRLKLYVCRKCSEISFHLFDDSGLLSNIFSDLRWLNIVSAVQAFEGPISARSSTASCSWFRALFLTYPYHRGGFSTVFTEIACILFHLPVYRTVKGSMFNWRIVLSPLQLERICLPITLATWAKHARDLRIPLEINLHGCTWWQRFCYMLWAEAFTEKIRKWYTVPEIYFVHVVACRHCTTPQ